MRPNPAHQSRSIPLPESHTTIYDYAEEVMATPRAHLALTVTQHEHGLSLTYQDRALVECYLTREGMAAASYMTRALGVHVPPIGESVKARVSTGVLFRAVSIASLNFDIEESFILLERWLEEAALQRTGSSDNT